ncbi:hypothetical protein GCM10007425_08490 [Lysinibacillus alkalisoli]|uniref:Uncharacterized protein n=1 Tax=Lysinibacillus alkalisoli TaxID=1911548 RepID=A0A917LEM7_9BACI|nr:hypothetical protein [Lysinibacillus alkalisoli]GGG16446.1 hypothetical protein GCM10007425_08490 [Lysinibacillus alkalisoli]
MLKISIIIFSVALPLLLAWRTLTVSQKVLRRLTLHLEKRVQSMLFVQLLENIQLTTDLPERAKLKVSSYIIPRLPRYLSEGALNKEDMNHFLSLVAKLQIYKPDDLHEMTTAFIKAHTEVRKSYKRPDDYNQTDEHALFLTYYQDIQTLWKEQAT